MTDVGGIDRSAAAASESTAPLSGWPAGWSVDHVASTGSTNEDLLARAAAGQLRDRQVLVADHQTAGRGRLDRRWEAPPSANLLASVAFVDPRHPSALTQRIGLAIVEAVEALVPELAAASPIATDPIGTDRTVTDRVGADRAVTDRVGADRTVTDRVGVKWPNDVLLDDAKLAGVLAQRSAQTGAVVVGFGVNVGWAPDGAISLDAVSAPPPSPLRLLAGILESFDAQPAGGDALRRRYRARLLTIDQRVRIELPSGAAVVGRALDVDEDGRLVVDDGTDRRTLDVGDVVHLRSAAD